MQQQIQRRDAYSAPSLSATIANREVELVSASMEREFPDPVQRSALTAATGELVAAEGENTTQQVATPWDPSTQWPPVPETAATVEMDMGAGPVQLLGNGRVTDASGGTDGHEVKIGVADQYQSLDRTISWDALAAAMPSESEAVIARYVVLHSKAVTDRILRYCGWYCTPPNLNWPVLSVPAMGTMWPERGTCATSIRQSDSAGYPGMYTEPWGKGVTDVVATYKLSTWSSIADRGRLEITAIAGRQNGGTMRVDAISDNGAGRVYISWSDTYVYAWVTQPDGTNAAVCSAPRGPSAFVYATFEYVNNSRVNVTLRVDGVTSTGTTACSTAVTVRPMTDGRISGSGVGGGFQIALPSSPGRLEGWKPNAVIYDRVAGPNALIVLPSAESENCADLLQQQCEAEAATYWIDETGVLRWWDLERLEAKSSVAALTADDDITDDGFSWSHDQSALRSGSVVKWRQPLRDWSWRTSVDLWQGGGDTLSADDDPKEEWINVPNDEVWIMPDLSLTRVNDGTVDDFNPGWFSWYGAIYASSGAWSNSVGVSIERVTDRAFKLRSYASSGAAVPITQRTPDNTVTGTGLWRSRQDMNLPVLRGKAKFMLTDISTRGSASGSATAPEQVVEADWWIQLPEQAQRVADYYAARLTVPQPTLSSIALIPVPGLQIGDMVEVRDEKITRLTVRGLVTSDSRAIGSDMRMSHAVAIRPLYITRNGVTWQEWASAARPKTRAQWASNQNSTWSKWGANPLLKEDVI